MLCKYLRVYRLQAKHDKIPREMNNDNRAGFATENMFENQPQTLSLTRTLYHTTQPRKVLMS